VLYESADGRSWQQVGAPLPGSAYEVKISGDRVLALDANALVAYVSSDGGHSFTTSNLQSLLPDLGDQEAFPVVDQLAKPGVDKLWPWDVRVGTDHVDVSYNETGHPTGTVAPLRTMIGTPERA
jgi:hypothetical protein